LKEGRKFIAYSPALDLSTSAGTFELARERFEEAVRIFFKELIRTGTLEEVLSDLGWQKQQKEWVPPLVISQELESIRLPAYHFTPPS